MRDIKEIREIVNSYVDADCNNASKIDAWCVTTVWVSPKELGETVEHQVAYFEERYLASEYAERSKRIRISNQNACPMWDVMINGESI